MTNPKPKLHEKRKKRNKTQERENYQAAFLKNCEFNICFLCFQVASTGGGDWEECYELVLHQARTVLSWSPGTQRALVMIGDAIPHNASYPQNTGNIDWKKETKALWKEMGVRIYAVQCSKDGRADFFYKHLAKETDGKHLQLDQFQNVIDMLMAICYREQGPDMFLVSQQNAVLNLVQKSRS